MNILSPFKILCKSKEELEKVMLILLSHNYSWSSGHISIRPPEFNSLGSNQNYYVFIYCNGNKKLTYDTIRKHDIDNNLKNCNNYSVITLSELEIMDKKF